MPETRKLGGWIKGGGVNKVLPFEENVYIFVTILDRASILGELLFKIHYTCGNWEGMDILIDFTILME